MRTAVRFPARTSLEQILDTLEHDAAFSELVTRWERLPAKPAQYAPFPEWLDGRIGHALRRRGIEQLYTHQAAALEVTRAGKNVVVVTPTASGKTLCYDLPVLDAIAKVAPRARCTSARPRPWRRISSQSSSGCRPTSTSSSRRSPTTATRHPLRVRRSARPGTSSSPTRTCFTPGSSPTTRSG